MSKGFSAALDISTEELLKNSQSNNNYNNFDDLFLVTLVLGSKDAVSTEQILSHGVL